MNWNDAWEIRSIIECSDGLTEDRKRHIFGVAEKMRALATGAGWDEQYVNDAEILGLLHDIGYQFHEEMEQYGHEIAGASYLYDNGYPMWQEVRWHGVTSYVREYDSDMLLMLNYADMSVGPCGQDFTFEERLEDIAYRYGGDSPQLLHATEIVNELYQRLG